MPPLIGGHPRIVATVNRVINLIVAAAFDRGNTVHVYGKRSWSGGLYTSLLCVIIPTLFPYFLPFWYPYILLRFLLLV